MKTNFIKYVLIGILAHLHICTLIIAQSPNSFKYQAVLRDASGNIKASTNTTVRIDILQGSTTGTDVYAETFAVQTNAFGLINLEIGKGTLVSGNFSIIDWSAGTYFIKITVDGTELGTSQLLSVPYALYAAKAGNGFSGSYNDLTNKPSIPTDLTQLVTDAGNRTITNVSAPVNNTDAANKAYIDALTSRIRDYDGNFYPVVKIGKQIWMASNLKTTHYANGDLIGTTSPLNKDISTETTPKYQWSCGGDENNVPSYGRLYTWYTITDNRKICPAGWHVPSDNEIITLLDTLGGSSVAGGRTKEEGTTHWTSPNTGGDNGSGFTALPGGDRVNTGTFNSLGSNAYFYDTGENGANGYYFYIYNTSASATRTFHTKDYGFSVRCIKDN
jgi:uncharacterized protein (TIGR02145 family)